MKATQQCRPNHKASKRILQRIRAALSWSALMVASYPATAPAQTDAAAKAGPQEVAAERDGQHDFDFEFGSWKAHIRRLLHPLTGSTDWVDLDGTSAVRKILDGRGNIGQLDVQDPAPHLVGMILRPHHPA